MNFQALTGAALLAISAPPSLAQPAQWPAPAAEAAAPEAEPPGEDVGLGEDQRQRMTVPISIDGKGPFDFLIDTGAERTVISAELARRLALPEGRRTTVHSMTGKGEVATAIIPKLEVSRKSVSGIHAPALKASHIGAAGMLGIDTLQEQRVTFDFARQKMTVVPSRMRETSRDPNEIVVEARRRFGRLVLVDASLDGERLLVVLDTGSEVTIGNQALRDKLDRKRKMPPAVPIDLVSVTGGAFKADYTRVRQIKIGGVMIRDLPVAFAEVHPFKQLELSDRPALLLGMDALRLFTQVSVDFANRKVRFASPELSRSSMSSRMAGLPEGTSLRIR